MAKKKRRGSKKKKEEKKKKKPGKPGRSCGEIFQTMLTVSAVVASVVMLLQGDGVKACLMVLGLALLLAMNFSREERVKFSYDNKAIGDSESERMAAAGVGALSACYCHSAFAPCLPYHEPTAQALR